MKHLRQLCAATVLTLMFALSTFAGEIQLPGIASPPPPPSTDISQSSTDSSDLTTATLIVLTIMEAISLP